MKTHHLKCWPVYYERVTAGQKMFEIRNNDRDFQVGDTIVLLEWDPKTESYTGSRTDQLLITYALHEHEGLFSGFVILQLSPLDNKR